MLQPAACEAGVMDQLCSSLTSFLNEESAKADAEAKACKKSCGWKKKKDDLLDTARKKAKESCSKGEAPDANELSKGLDRNTKDRLKALYDNNSRMFDGTAKLKAVDFNAASSKDATVTGKTAALSKGGQVTNLKSAEPATPKLNAASELSLTKAPADLVCSGGQVFIPDCNCLPYENKHLGGMCQNDCYAAIAKQCSLGGGTGIKWLDNLVKNLKRLPQDIKELPENIKTAATLVKDKTVEAYHKLKGETEKCGVFWYNPDKNCCIGKKKVGLKCESDCYNPATECCLKGKKIKKLSDPCECFNLESPCAKDTCVKTCFDKAESSCSKQKSIEYDKCMCAGLGGIWDTATNYCGGAGGRKFRKGCIIKGGGCHFSVAPNPKANSKAPYYEWAARSKVGEYQKIIDKVANETGVDPQLIKAIMYMETTHGWYEAPFRWVGLNDSILPMNINTNYWGDIFGDRSQLKNPEANIRAGAEMLKRIQNNLPDNASVADIATLYNNLNATQVSDYGARVAILYLTNPWLSIK